MTNRLPTANQARILAALRDAETTFTIHDGAIAPGLATKKQVASLINAGWADPSDGVLTLSGNGEIALGDAEGRAAYREHSLDNGGDMRVRVKKRSRGGRSIFGGKTPDGRNVTCNDCYRAAQARFEAGETRVRGDSIVWFTNESGAAAQREAEIAAGKHILRHLSGDLVSS